MAANMNAGMPQANGTTAPEPTMDVEDVARSVTFMASLCGRPPVSIHVLSLNPDDSTTNVSPS